MVVGIPGYIFPTSQVFGGFVTEGPGPPKKTIHKTSPKPNPHRPVLNIFEGTCELQGKTIYHVTIDWTPGEPNI